MNIGVEYVALCLELILCVGMCLALCSLEIVGTGRWLNFLLATELYGMLRISILWSLQLLADHLFNLSRSAVQLLSYLLLFIVIIIVIFCIKKVILTKLQALMIAAMAGVLLLLALFVQFLNVRRIYWPNIKVVIFVFVAALLIVFFSIVALFRKMFEEQKKQTQLKMAQMEKQYLERLLQEHQRSFDLWRKSIHDFKNQLYAIEHMVNTNQKQQLLQYIHQTHNTNQELAVYVKTGSSSIDALLTEKARYAQAQDIPFTMNVSMPKPLLINDMDLCALLGNLIDNALEASLKEKERRIEVVISHERFFNLRVSNLCKKNPLLENRFSFTTKANEEFHGIGIKSIETICRKYNGIIEKEYKDDSFSIHILLHES